MQCLNCGKEFEAKTKRAKYCSPSCKEKARINRNKVEKVCLHCGKTFMGFAKYEHKFCSPGCSTKHNQIVKTLTCIDCGVSFTFEGRTRKLRCDACWKKHRSAQTMMYRAIKDPTVKLGVGSGNAQHPNSDVYVYSDRDITNDKRRRKYQQDKQRSVLRESYPYRKIIRTGNDSCCLCGYNTRQEALVVHHIDMNRMNNDLDNLAIVCCNCHAIIHAEIRMKMKHDNSVNAVNVFNSLKGISV